MRINRVQRQQQMQIRRGVRNSSISQRQAARLQRHAKRIKAAERKDNLTGPPTAQERSQMKRALRRQQHAIKGAKGKSPQPVASPPAASTPPLG